jgi:hypothetical protein
MKKPMKWALSGAIYLALVIGGYSLYQAVSPAPEPVHQMDEPHATQSLDTHGEAAHGHEPGTAAGVQSQASVTYDNKQITIAIRDVSGKPVEDFQVNHEKLLHLIVVSEDLQQYYHLHPEYQGKGTFTLPFPLKDGAYKAFVDVKPKNTSYAVTPILLQVGQARSHEQHGSLVPDPSFSKTVDGRKVTMEPSSLKAGVPVTLRFVIHDGTPEPYLGALGHVVILNETADQYVHVHPLSETETAFETQFSQPGVYKIWGEFKLNGKVHTYPFVVELK